MSFWKKYDSLLYLSVSFKFFFFFFTYNSKKKRHGLSGENKLLKKTLWLHLQAKIAHNTPSIQRLKSSSFYNHLSKIITYLPPLGIKRFYHGVKKNLLWSFPRHKQATFVLVFGPWQRAVGDKGMKGFRREDRSPLAPLCQVSALFRRSVHPCDLNLLSGIIR